MAKRSGRSAHAVTRLCNHLARAGLGRVVVLHHALEEARLRTEVLLACRDLRAVTGDERKVCIEGDGSQSARLVLEGLEALL